jgi:hypothetical protein
LIDILSQIQADLLDRSASLSDILRKAKVLASQLGSKELDFWVSQELDGYKDKNSLPDYRLLRTSVAGTWTNGFYVQHFRGVPLYAIKDENLKKGLTTYYVTNGISTVEGLANLPDDQKLSVATEVLAYVNSLVGQHGYGYTQLFYSVDAHNFKQILDTVKNRLLDFVLKLGKEWKPKESPPGQTEIGRLISITIYNSPQGGTMALFDQRGQHVQYQFNAAGNINIEQVHSLDELIAELAKLREEVDRAKQSGAIPAEVAIEVQYHLLEVSREAASDHPDKLSVHKGLNKARELLKDLSAVAGLAASLAKLAEIASKLFS